MGPQVARQKSAPMGVQTSLIDPDLYNGKAKSPLPKAVKPEVEAKKSAKPKTNFVVNATTAKKSAAPEKANAEDANDLKRISGVGPKIEGILNSLGIYRFDQIASWTRENIEWVDEQLKFKGRIDREGWIDQAKKLQSEEKG